MWLGKFGVEFWKGKWSGLHQEDKVIKKRCVCVCENGMDKQWCNAGTWFGGTKCQENVAFMPVPS